MGLTKVFVFWLEQLGKLFNLMKQIPIYENSSLLGPNYISLFHVFIAFCIISIFVSFIKLGIHVNMVERSMSYWRKDNGYTGRHTDEYLAKHRKGSPRYGKKE